jgi:predicted lipid carrier protein YhbT
MTDSTETLGVSTGPRRDVVSRSRRLTALPWGLPDALQRLAVEAGLNAALAGLIVEGRLDFLEGRVLAVESPAIRLRWPLSLLRRRLLVLPAAVSADAVIRGDPATLLALACRRIDPDTAFFQRRLVIEGDTDLGLAAKNALDAFDPHGWPPLLRRLLQ